MIENLISGEGLILSKNGRAIEEFLKIKKKWKKFYWDMFYISNLDFSNIKFNPKFNNYYPVFDTDRLSLSKIKRIYSKLPINLDIRDCDFLFKDSANNESQISISYFKKEFETSSFLGDSIRKIGDEVNKIISLKEYLLLQSFYYYYNEDFLDKKSSTFLKPISLINNKLLFLTACYDKETKSIIINTVDFSHCHPTNGARIKQ